MSNQAQVEILAFTDPVCTWCWGSEPVMRKLQARYGDQIRITPVMGGLVRDIREFRDHANDIGGEPEQSNAQIARHWLEASERHRMPVRTEGFKLFSADVFSTYPQNIAYKAVELASPNLASRYLRRMREASAAEARETGKRAVLLELASEVGVDLASMMEHLDNGSAELAFRNDLQTTHRYGVHGFPTVLFRSAKDEILVRGYQSYNSMKSVLNSMTGGQLQEHAPEKTSAAVLQFLQSSGRSAPVELEAVFDLPPEELAEILTHLHADQRIRAVEAGNGCFWEARTTGLSCDPVSGVCSL